MFEDIVDNEEIGKIFQNTTDFLCNYCNSCNTFNNPQDIRGLSDGGTVTEVMAADVTDVADHRQSPCQLSLPEVVPAAGSATESENTTVKHTCFWCGSTNFWQGDGRMICRRCHPPAPGAERRNSNKGGK